MAMTKKPFVDSDSIKVANPVVQISTMKFEKENTVLTLTFKKIWENAINTLLTALGIIFSYSFHYSLYVISDTFFFLTN